MNEREMVLADATLHARFWQKVNVRGADECWSWLANKSAGRYGAIKVGGKRGKDLKAHRIQMIWQGVEVEGKVVRHKCDNPLCVNPAHLEVGSQLDNVQDMLDRGRGNHASGECNGLKFCCMDKRQAESFSVPDGTFLVLNQFLRRSLTNFSPSGPAIHIPRPSMFQERM